MKQKCSICGELYRSWIMVNGIIYCLSCAPEEAYESEMCYHGGETCWTGQS